MAIEKLETNASQKTWKLRRRAIIIGFLILIFMFALISYIPFWWWNYCPTTFSPSEFGDAFGMANAFFSMLAFGGVICTLYLQMEELKLQRKEMVESQRVQMLVAKLNYLNTKRNSSNRKSESNLEIEEDHLIYFIDNHIHSYLTENAEFTTLQVNKRICDKLRPVVEFMESAQKKLSSANNNEEIWWDSCINTFPTNEYEELLLWLQLSINAKGFDPSFQKQYRKLFDTVSWIASRFDSESELPRLHPENVKSLFRDRRFIEAFQQIDRYYTVPEPLKLLKNKLETITKLINSSFQ